MDETNTPNVKKKNLQLKVKVKVTSGRDGVIWEANVEFRWVSGGDV